MRNTLAMLFVLAASVAGSSQEKSFNLNKYKFPDYKRHELEVNFNSSGSSHLESRDGVNSMNIPYTYVNSNFNSNSHFKLGYEYNYLTRKRIDNVSFSILGDYDYEQYKNEGQKISQSNPTITGVLSGFNRYYLIGNTFFFEGLTNCDYSFYESKITTPERTHNQYSNNNSLHLSVGLGLGKGRMEKVSDLWQAYYILEKLNKQNSFGRQLEEKDVYEFATFASKLKNKRILDFRTKRIYELKGLDSLLHQQGLINESDISYFTTLNDYWSYGNFPKRESGIELKFWAAPDYTFYSNDYNNSNADEYQKTSLISNVSFNWTKQLNLFWEKRFNALVSYEVMLDTIGYLQNYQDNNIRTNVNCGYGYYPNSRTDLHAEISYRGQVITTSNSESLKDKEWSSMVALNLSGNYYFSPHLQLVAGYSINYTDKQFYSFDVINHSYNLSLRYAIF